MIPDGQALWGAYVASGYIYGANRQSAQEVFEAQVGRRGLWNFDGFRTPR